MVKGRQDRFIPDFDLECGILLFVKEEYESINNRFGMFGLHPKIKQMIHLIRYIKTCTYTVNGERIPYYKRAYNFTETNADYDTPEECFMHFQMSGKYSDVLSDNMHIGFIDNETRQRIGYPDRLVHRGRIPLSHTAYRTLCLDEITFMDRNLKGTGCQEG